MRLPMAVSAALAALLLCAAAFAGPAVAAGAVVLVVLAIAWGWPRQMGAPARMSLSAAIALVGVVATVLMLVWPPAAHGHHGAWALFEPLAVVLAWGSMAAFVVQLVRGTGRPLRLESTVAAMGGVLIVVMAASWVALARWTEVPGVAAVVLTLGVTVAAVSLIGLTPWMQGRPGVLALALIPAAAVVAGLVAAALGAPTPVLADVVLAALAAAALVALTATTAPSSRPRPEDRPVATTLRPRRAGYALALAPVGAAGVIGHVLAGVLA